MSARLSILRAALGGDLNGRTLTCPTIGHRPKDRGTSYTEKYGAPGNLLAYVHNGTEADHIAAKDRALEILGERQDFRQRDRAPDPIEAMRRRAARQAAEEAERADAHRRQQYALTLWNAGRDPRGTVVQHYLASRSLTLLDDVAGEAIRFLDRCRWEGGTVLAMVCAMRDVRTGEVRAVHRTALTDDGRKIGRKMLGPAAGTAVMLDPEEAVAGGLTIGEGVETTLAARELGLTPAWAMCSADAMRLFPVLPGIETLTLLAENDESGVSDRACREAGTRWHRAGRAVDIVRPRAGKDMNDVLTGGASGCR